MTAWHYRKEANRDYQIVIKSKGTQFLLFNNLRYLEYPLNMVGEVIPRSSSIANINLVPLMHSVSTKKSSI